ncbi:MAG TPA: sulfatase-like hydrolase/transferase [Polyangiaceae bacterium]|nr:sulfatase-like hydrolase/transferase [Polyangiaceae bacterium]
MLAALGVLAIELVVVAIAARRELASIWELQFGTLWLLPNALGLAGLSGAVGAGVFHLVERAEARGARLALSGLAGGFAGLVGYGVGGGRHLASLPVRLGFALGLALVAAAVVAGCAPRLARAVRNHPRVFGGVLALVVVALELANGFVLPRLYPAFHWGLSVLCLVLAPGLAETWFRGVGAGAFGRAVPAVLAVAVLAAPWAAERLAGFDNYRFLLMERAPLLGRIVELAARFSPPPPLADEGGPCAGSLEPCGDSASGNPAHPVLDLRDRDILLVSIDALRADHVGAYGYARATTPHIDALAREGVVFEYAYTATPHTSYAITSLLTGKYMRPLLLQGAGADSDTWASLLRTYGYRTAAFFPPAVFFIDTERFAPMQRNQLGFEYVKVEFAEGEKRLSQVREYLDRADTLPLFLWVHLFGPHEPYVAHPEHPFGKRDIDRYDSEIAATDATLGAIVKHFRKARPRGVVIVTADHGEEFGEHGGRYHGTTVYEEQVRVPLVLSAPGALPPRRIAEVVQSIDVLPTVLAALAIPRPPRVRGRDLSAVITGRAPSGPGLAHAETDEHVLLARGPLRLICARRAGACRLYDLAGDPGQTRDAANERPAELAKLRAELREIAASHGRYESRGLRAEGKGWPGALVRAIAGDGDAAPEVAALLDDAELEIRRKAAQVLFDLRHPDTASALRLALARDEDARVRHFAALALTRLGEAPPLADALLDHSEPLLRRLAALAFAEAGDARGERTLIAWWQSDDADFSRRRELLGAFTTLRSRAAIPALLERLDDVRLRPHIARTLAQIGDPSPRPVLTTALANERSHEARAALLEALLALGAGAELKAPLIRLLGVPDPLPHALEAAVRAGILAQVGGPSERALAQLATQKATEARLRVSVPKGGNGTGLRALVRARCAPPGNGGVFVASATRAPNADNEKRPVPQRGKALDPPEHALRLEIPCTGAAHEVHAVVPERFGIGAGAPAELVVRVERSVAIEALALVPLADEIPPPPPEPFEQHSAARPAPLRRPPTSQ